MSTVKITNWHGETESIDRMKFCERWHSHNIEICGLAFDLQSEAEIHEILKQLADLADRAFTNKLKGE